MSDGLDILAIGAHPDDVEVHVGGILALAVSKGLRAGILDLTEGDLGTRGTPETRRMEARAAAEILGVPRTILDFPDGRFTEDEPYRIRLIHELRRLRPRVLIIPSPTDRHPDHERAHRFAREAAFYAGLKNYPCEGLPFRPEALAWVGGENPGTPDLVVDVSDVWEQRMRAFDAFGSQFSVVAGQPQTRISSPAFRRGIEGRSMHWGSLLGVAHGEALWCDLPVPPVLMELLVKLR
ncbi:MAG TPA: bacillithiol biosynthesis deacetylase BshB1 [Holophagaceae bacterium]|nr:bacillithiol biosynthesis deacetylase BshB1 [Holophagaceae bacterium]